MKDYFHIFRVPLNWEHSIDDATKIDELSEKTTEAMVDWFAEYAKWHLIHKAQIGEEGFVDFWSTVGLPPHRKDLLFGELTGEGCCYQIYYVEGYEYIPVSPVFSDLEKIGEWLLEYGFPEMPCTDD